MVCIGGNTSATNSRNTQTHDSINCTHQPDHRSRARSGHTDRDQRRGQKPRQKLASGSKTFGNGDGEHTVGDYADEAIKIIKYIAGELVFTNNLALKILARVFCTEASLHATKPRRERVFFAHLLV